MQEMDLETFCTYLMCGLEYEPCLEFSRLVVGRERHEGNGEIHFHCYLYYPNKIRVRKPTGWDFALAGPDLFHNYNLETGEHGGIKRKLRYAHPNIKRLPKKRDIREWIEYCKKGGEFISIGMPAVPINSDNYIKKRADQQAWEQDAKAATLKDPFPFRLPNGEWVQKPKLDENGYPAVKKRHYCFLAPASSGKTSYFEREFKGKSVYLRPAGNKYLFEKGSYQQQQIIIYDDVWPKWEELTSVCNVYYGQAQVYGDSRYTPNYWKPGQQRIVIMLLNKENLPGYIKDPTHPRHKLFLARFMLRNWPIEAMPPRREDDNMDLDDETREILNEVQREANNAAVQEDQMN